MVSGFFPPQQNRSKWLSPTLAQNFVKSWGQSARPSWYLGKSKDGRGTRRLFRKWKQSYIYILYNIYIHIISYLIWEGWNTNQKSTSVLQHFIYIGGIEYPKNNHVCFPFLQLSTSISWHNLGMQVIPLSATRFNAMGWVSARMISLWLVIGR